MSGVSPALALLSELRELGVSLALEGEQLRYRGSSEVLTPALLEKMRAQKPQLLELLQSNLPKGSTWPRSRS